ncbi:MAG: virulence factor SrfC family protein [Pseudomonadota bacterium]
MPQQKLLLAIKRSSERVAALDAWVGAQPQDGAWLAAAGMPALLVRDAERLDALQLSVEQAPTLGLLDGVPLIERLLAINPESDTPHHRTARALLAFLGDGEPGMPSDRASVALRFASERPSAGLRQAPFHVRLLSLADLAIVFAGAHLLSSNGAHQAGPPPVLMRRTYEALRQRLGPNMVRGFSMRDAVRVRDTLERMHPQARALEALEATGYWDDLIDAADHLPAAQRVDALSLLWHGEPRLTARFKALAGELEQIAYLPEVYVAGAGLETMAAPTLQADDGTADEPMVRLVSRFGPAVSMRVSAMNELAAEITVPLSLLPPPAGGGAMAAGNVGIDVMALPAAVTLDEPIILGGHGDEQVEDAAINGRLAASKRACLADAAVHDAKLSALALVVGAHTTGSQAWTRVVADWVDQAQGSEPFQREQMSDALFLIYDDRPDERATIAAAADPLRAAMKGGVGAGEVWPHTWTPGLAFDNHHALDLSVVEGERAVRVDAGLASLLVALTQTCSVRTKQRQLRRMVQDTDEVVESRLLRFQAVQDGQESAEWRRRAVTQTTRRLDVTQQGGRLNTLLKALSVTPAVWQALHWRMVERDGEGAMVMAPQGAIADFDDENAGPTLEQRHAEALAQAALRHWMTTMRRRAAVPGIARKVHLTPAMMRCLGDEIAIGAMRTDVITRMARALTALPNALKPGGALAFAEIANAHINGFVSALTTGEEDDAAVLEMLGVTRAPLETGSAIRDGGAAAIARHWRHAFYLLSEKNIAAARFLQRQAVDPALAPLAQAYPAFDAGGASA